MTRNPRVRPGRQLSAMQLARQCHSDRWRVMYQLAVQRRASKQMVVQEQSWSMCRKDLRVERVGRKQVHGRTSARSLPRGVWSQMDISRCSQKGRSVDVPRSGQAVLTGHNASSALAFRSAAQSRPSSSTTTTFISYPDIQQSTVLIAHSEQPTLHPAYIHFPA